MANISWTGAAGDGNYNNPANWNPAQVPGAGDTVTISTSVATAISAGNDAVLNLTTNSDVTLNLVNNDTFTFGSAGSAASTFSNGGTFALNSTNNATELIIAAPTLSLTGAGTILLSNNGNNYIYGSAAGDELNNVSNLIEGGGQLGDGTLTFVNGAAGVVNANVSTGLVLNTGSATTLNSGILESTSTGGLVIESTVNDGTTGKIIAAGGNVYLQGGDLQGGTISTSAGGEFIENANATLDGTTHSVTNTGTVVVDNNTTLNVLGTIANSGTILISSANNGTELSIGPSATAGTVTLTGSGHVVLSDNASNYIAGAIAGDTLINLNNTISGAGTFTSPLTLTNDATIDANAATNALVINTGAVVTNNSLLEATVATDGGLIINTVINNGTLGIVSAATGNVYLQSASLEGGTIKTSGGGEVYETATGTLDGSAHAVTNLGTVTVDNNQTLNLLGSIVNNGTLALASANNGTVLEIDSATVSLTGTGAISLSNNANNYIYGAVGSDVLNNVHNTISGAGQIGTGGSITLINGAAGVIDANASAGLTFDVGTVAVANSGLIEATGTGVLSINSTTINDSTGGTLLAGGADIYLNTGTVVGGLVKATGGASVIANSGTNLLSGASQAVTVAGSVEILNNQLLDVAGTITNTGTISLLSANNGTVLEATSPTLTLNGGGVISLSDNANNYIESAAGADIFDNVNNLISGSGTIGNGTFTLINAAGGTISATGTNASLAINTGDVSVANSGLIEAVGPAGLVLESTLITNGTLGVISANGGDVYLNSATIAGGTLSGTTATSFVDQTTATLDGTSTTVTNDTTVTIANDEVLTVLGTITNVGTISLSSANNGTDLNIGPSAANGTVVLTGGGQVLLSNNQANYVEATIAGNTLDNLNNTIDGGGTIGSNSLFIINANGGIIDANVATALVINTGTATTTNSGVLEATAGGSLVLQSVIADGTSGTILAAGGNVYLDGADIQGGTLTSSAGGVIYQENSATDAGSTLDGTTNTVVVNGSLVVNNDCGLGLLGTIDNLGTISLASTNSYTDLDVGTNTGSVASTVTLTGSGMIVLSNNTANAIQGGIQGDTLDNLNNTISGAGVFSSNLVLVNATGGTIDANDANALFIQTGSNVVTNNGVLESTSTGGLILQSTVDNGTAGSIAATGGGVYLDGTTIEGGTLTASGGGTIYQENTAGYNGSTLDGTTYTVTISGPLVVENDCGLGLLGKINNLGTISLDSTNNTTDLDIGVTSGSTTSTVTLTGGGAVVLSDNSANLIGGGISGDELLNVNNTISGAGSVNSNLDLVNASGGVIDATGANALIVATGSYAVSNSGLMESTNTGGLVLQSVVNNGTAGRIVAAGGTVFLDGTTIQGGTLAASAGGTIYQEDTAGYNGSTLDGTDHAITVSGPLVVDNDAGLGLLGTINNLGTILVDSTNSTTDLYIGVTSGSTPSTVTLTGTGTIALSDNSANQIDGGITGDVLDNVSNTINGAGTFNGNVVLDNSGIVEATDSDNTLIIQSPTITNLAGGQLLAANGATLLIETGTLTNQGLIQADDASFVTFQSNETLTNNANNGTLTGGSYGAVSTGDGATLSITGSAVSTIAATIILSGAASTIEFGGTTIDASLQTIAAGGTLSLLSGRAFTATANSGTLADNGLLSLGGTSFTAASLAIGTTGTLSGYGTLAGPVSDAGLINATGGTLTFTSAVSGAGTLAAAAGATVDLTVPGALAEKISGAGTLQLDGGTYTISNETVAIGTVKVDSGSALTGSGTLTGALIDSGSVNASGGTLVIDGVVNTGTFSAGASATLDLAGGGSFTGLISGAGTLEIASHAFTLTSGGSLTVANVLETANFTLASDAYTNAAGKHFTIDAGTGQTVVLGATGTGRFSNAGTFLANGPGIADIATTFADTGTASVTAGTLLLAKTLSGSGTLSAGTNSVLEISGGGTFSGAINGAGTVDVGVLTLSTGASLTASNVVETGGLSLVSDALTIAAGHTFTMATTAGKTLVIGGTGTGASVTNAGSFIVSGGGEGYINTGFTDTGTASVTAGTLLLAKTLAGSGTLSAGAGALLEINGGGSFSGALTGAGTLALGSTITFTTGATLSAANVLQTGSLTLASVALTNSVGDTYTIDAAKTALISYTGTSSLTNAGTLLSNGAGTATIGVAFADTGFASVTAGTLALTKTLTGTGTLSAGTGAVLAISGGGTFTGAITGAGTVDLGALTLSTGASLTASNVVETGGLSLVSDALTIASGHSFTMATTAGKTLVIGGTGTGAGVTNAGSFIVSGGGEGYINTGFTDTGTASVTAGTLLLARTLAGSGTLSAGAGALLEINGGGSFSGALTGAGTLALGTTTVTLSTGASLSAANVLQTGSLTLASVALTNGAGDTYTIDAAKTALISYTGTSSLTNAGTLLSNGAGTATIGVAFADTGLASVTAGTLALTKALTGTGTLSAGTGAVLAISGGGTFTGAITGAGTVDIGVLTLSTGASLSATTVVQTGGLSLVSDAVTIGAGHSFAMSTTSGASLVIGGTGTGTSLTNAGTFSANGAGTGIANLAFINTGTVNANAGTLSFLGAVTNNGTIDAASGLASVKTTVSGTGTLEIGSAGTLSLLLGAGSGQVVDFAASAGLLDLTKPLDFTGSIAGFSGSDQIDVLNTAYTQYNYNTGTDVLTLKNGSATVASLQFIGTSGVTVQSDGHSGALITFG